MAHQSVEVSLTLNIMTTHKVSLALINEASWVIAESNPLVNTDSNAILFKERIQINTFKNKLTIPVYFHCFVII